MGEGLAVGMAVGAVRSSVSESENFLGRRACWGVVLQADPCPVAEAGLADISNGDRGAREGGAHARALGTDVELFRGYRAQHMHFTETTMDLLAHYSLNHHARTLSPLTHSLTHSRTHALTHSLTHAR